MCSRCETYTYRNYCLACYKSTLEQVRRIDIRDLLLSLTDVIPTSSSRSYDDIIEILLTLSWLRYHNTNVVSIVKGY